jgi:adenosylcobinamide-GDP ribazoletransferase
MSDEQPARPRQDNERQPRVGPATVTTQPGFGDDLVMAIRFFSRLPAGDSPYEKPDLDRMARILPFVSVIVGFGPVLLMMLLCWMGVPAFFAAAIGVGAMIAVTGAMTDDALADAADGLAGGSDVDRRLEIMKDSRHGTYGVVAIGLYLILRVTAIGALAVYNPVAAGGVWLASSLIGRSGSLWLSVELPNAREGGASAAVGRVSRGPFAIGAGFGVLLALVLAAPFTSFVALVLALLAAGLVAMSWVWVCRKLIGGQTGDLIGALGALIEVAALTAFLIFA